MKCVAVRRGESEPTVVEKPAPTPASGEVLVRTLRVGVDGTDHEVIDGSHGGFPPGDDHLVLGHEAVGVVEDANGTDLEEGTLVAPTIRRVPPESDGNRYFDRGEPDMAPPGEYVERGIDGAHGFMAEYFTSPVEFLVEVPERLLDVGFLIEPSSITTKALEVATASRSSFGWEPESALVLGNGSLGLLTLAMLDKRYDSLYCLGRRDRPDPTIEFIERLGATYVDSRETPVAEIADSHGEMDFVYEATGHARHPFEAMEALAPGGVVAMLGIPSGDWAFDVPGARLHRETVLRQTALVGSVCSHVRHFEAGIDALLDLPDWVFDSLVTRVVELDEVSRAFETGPDILKTAVTFGTRD